MTEPTITWVEATKNAVKSLQERYKQNRGMLLTEGDLECHLFSELMKQTELSGYHPSKNDTFWNKENGETWKTSYVHSQVTWFKPDQKSGYEVDLTIGRPSLLEVCNIELFEEYTSKGFAYDGPCVALELKYLRNQQKASQHAHEDFLKFIVSLIPSKLENIKIEKYKKSSENNIAFVSVVGCKDENTFIQAKYYLGKHLLNRKSEIPSNLFVGLFYQDEVIWNMDELMEFYNLKEKEIRDNK